MPPICKMEGFDEFLQQHLVQQQNSIISHFEILDVFFRMQGVSAKQVGDKTRCDMQKSMYHSARFKRVRAVCPAVGACKGFGWADGGVRRIRIAGASPNTSCILNTSCTSSI